MLRYIREGGYVTVPKGENTLVLRADKSNGKSFTFKRGDGQILSLDLRYEQRKDDRSPRRQTDAHLPPPGREWHTRQGKDCGGGKNRRIQGPPITKKANKADKDPFHRASTKNIARRLAAEGDELTIELRLVPEMANEEIIVLEGFGGDIDGPWQTASVVHRLGHGSARTEAACWRK